MTKSELLRLLSDVEVRNKIVEIVRFGVKSPPKSAVAAAAKADLMFLLCDEEVRKEILKILRDEDKTPAPVKKSAPPPKPQKQITSTGADLNVMALREQVRNRVTQRDAAPTVEPQPKTNNDAEFTYISEKTCPICEQKTRIVQVKKHLVPDKRDLDFCVHYKNFNQYLYSVWVCEHCGYAADSSRFQERFAYRVRKALHEFLSQNNFRTPFVNTRTVNEALTFYESAIYLNETFELSFGRQAGLYHKMAWVYRIAGDSEKEKECLLKCAELYEKSLDKEHYPIGKVSDNFATYIIGANYFMLKDFDKAQTYLNMIMNNPNILSTAPKLYEKARDVWLEIRSARK